MLSVSESTALAPRALSGRPTLRRGAKGSAVVDLQNRLRAAGYKITADGDFGARTLAAVKGYQKARGLRPDGVVGPATWGRLLAAPAGSGTPVLKSGARGAAVVNLQNRLKAHGFNVGAADGSFGPRTLAAVKAFQKARRLTADGVVGPATWSRLNASPPASGSGPVLKSGMRGPAVVSLQRRLSQLGFGVGTADGSFGPKTLAAVKAFQRSRALGADGVVGPATWTKLGIHVKGSASSGTPAPTGSGPVLRAGQRGTAVRALQNRLNQLGFSVGVADGSFGPKTASAVKRFQKSRGLSADGVVGPATWTKLGIHVKGTATAPSGGATGGGGMVVTGYVNGVPRKIRLARIPHGRYLRSDAANAFNKMYAAARNAGIHLPVNGGFRSMAQQRYLYSLYKSGKGNLAAKPGYSNHQGGIAVDISVGGTWTRTYKWVAANAWKYGFKRTVPSEPWHWEYRK